jgi:hypothetical protein
VCALFGRQLHHLLVVVKSDTLWLAHNCLDAVFMVYVQHFIHLVVVVRLVLKPENLH